MVPDVIFGNSVDASPANRRSSESRLTARVLSHWISYDSGYPPGYVNKNEIDFIYQLACIGDAEQTESK